jgi:acyl-CoA reductase-like NAD-dependent aldehyde dehydrogenase
MRTWPVYLNGNWITTKNTSDVVNPATGEVFARMSMLERPQVAQGV